MKFSILKLTVLSVVLILAQQSAAKGETGMVVLGILGVSTTGGTTTSSSDLTDASKRDSIGRERERERVKKRKEMERIAAEKNAEENAKNAEKSEKEWNSFVSKLPQKITFVNSGGIPKEVFDDLETEFLSYKKFDIIDRAVLEKIRSEQRLQRSGETDEQSAIAAGKLAGVDAIVFAEEDGNRKFDNRYLRAVNVQNGRIIALTMTKPFSGTDLFKIDISKSIPKNYGIAILPSNLMSYNKKNSAEYKFLQASVEYVLLSAGYSVVDRSVLEKIRSEQKLQTSAEFDSKTAVSIGKISGANAIIDLKYNGDATNFNARAIDVQNGELLLSGTFPSMYLDREMGSLTIPEVNLFTSKIPQKIALSKSDAVSEKLFDILESQFVNDGKVKVIDRMTLNKILTEQRLQVSGEIDEKSAVAAGKLSGVEAVVFIDNVKSNIQIGTRICDVYDYPDEKYEKICNVNYKDSPVTTIYLRAVNVQNGGVIASQKTILPNAIKFSSEVSANIPSNSRIAIFSSHSEVSIHVPNVLDSLYMEVGRRIGAMRIAKERPKLSKTYAKYRNGSVSDYRIVQASVESALLSAGYSIVDRSSLDKIRSEQKIQMSEEFDSKTAVSIGKFSGANVIIDLKINSVLIGTNGITDIGFTARAIDVKSGRVLFSKRFN